MADKPIRLIGPTRYLDNARAVVTHTIDDASPYVPACLDAIDSHGLKATVFVNTAAQSLVPLWPRLRQAAADGHEIGAHSRRHRCRIPDTFVFCLGALSRDEIEGARQDILRHIDQPHVWTWAYPCGNCADRKLAQRRIARAGYIAARAYPERDNRHVVPDLQTYDANPLAARYTQVAQRGYVAADGRAVPGRTDVGALNAKFDEVHSAGGIYSFVTHPQMVDYGPDGFYRRHLRHVGARGDVWYVPMGPLYAYRALREETSVTEIAAAGARAAFALSTRLDPRVYCGSVTLEFRATVPVRVTAAPATRDTPGRPETPVAGRELPERPGGPVDRWDGEYLRRAGDRLWVTVRPNTVLAFQ